MEDELVRRLEIPWAIQPRQMRFLAACGLDHVINGGHPRPPEADVICYGGAAGGGKTDALLVAGLILCALHDGIQVGFFRRKFPQLKGAGGAIVRSKALYSDLGVYNGGEHRWDFPRGSSLYFCHCQHEDDVESYQSQQFDVILIDESTHFTEYQIRYLQTRNRANIAGFVPFMALGTNPGNISHNFHREVFVASGPPNEARMVEIEPGAFVRIIFIPALLSDNKELEERDPGYRRRLEAQSTETREALLYGNWDVFAGQYFKSFRQVTVEGEPWHVVSDMEIPDSWRRFGSMDWGYIAPSALHWHALDPATARVYTYREAYVNQMLASEVAQLWLDMTPDSERLEYIKASPDMWREVGLVGDSASQKARGARPGRTIAQEFIDRGLPLEPADNRRVIGWTQVREYLEPGPDGLPMWRILSCCTDLIRTLPALIHDRRKVEDVDGDCEDHAPESCRYFLISRPSPAGLGSFYPGMRAEGPDRSRGSTDSAGFHFDREVAPDGMRRDDYEDEGEADIGFFEI